MVAASTRAELPDAWDDPPPPPTSGAPVLSVAGFEGPLDWLVEMARAGKVDLARLSIVALVQSFCAAMESALPAAAGAEARPSDLPRWADWLVLAATLTQLRSRLLLPADAPEAQTAHSEAEALRRQIIGRARTAAAADWLERRMQLGQEVFPRGVPEAAPGPGRATDTTDLLRACLVALRVPEERAAAYRPRAAPFWRVPDALDRIEALLRDRPQGAGLGAFLPRIDGPLPGRELRCRAALASTLIASLELARQRALTLDQRETWSPILITGAEADALTSAAPPA